MNGGGEVRGLIGYGSYVPHWRLARQAIADAHSGRGGPGTRAVASFDEDSTSMGVEASRSATAATGVRQAVRRLYFATGSPAYLEKSNASAIHAALQLSPNGLAVDMAGGIRSGVGALLAAGDGSDTTMAVLADLRVGLPGSADERDGGDGAAAFVFGADDVSPVLAILAGTGSVTVEILDRWRLPTQPTVRSWEERFTEDIYFELAALALSDALKDAGIVSAEVDHLVVSCPSKRAGRRIAAGSGVPDGALAADLGQAIGYAGAAHVGLALADVLDRAEPGERIAVVVVADGATAVVLEVTDALPAHRPARTVRSQIDGGDADLSYTDHLVWRGMLARELTRRPDPTPPAAPPSFRGSSWKFGLVASRCEVCATRAVPPARTCAVCGAVDRMEDDPIQDVQGTVTTFTADHLVFTPNPPMLSAIVDFDGGGRIRCELTDVAPDAVAVGTRVEMTFRRMFTSGDIHNYFWKARPVRGTEA